MGKFRGGGVSDGIACAKCNGVEPSYFTNIKHLEDPTFKKTEA
jgi:hypothetical protein